MVADIDAEWIALLKNMFETSGYGETQSLVRARIYYFHQIGYYALDLKEDRDERVHLYPFYHEVLVGGTISKDLERTLADLSEAHTTSPKRK